MNIFETILFNSILIVAPLLCYFIYLFLEKTLDKKKNDLFLDCALYTSFYLLIKFGKITYGEVPIILLDIPLIIAYIKSRNVSVIVLSILTIFCYEKMFDFNIYFIIAEYLFYYILYIFKDKLKKHNFITIYLIFKIFVFYSHIYFGKIFILNTFEKYSSFIILVLFFYFITKFIINMFDNIESATSLYNVTMDIEDDKRTKESLFKITHEIKNPIAVCKGYLDMFDVENKEHSKKYIPIIKEEIKRVLVLLEDFLCINRIKIEKEEMDLSLLLEDIENSFTLMLKDRNISLLYKKINDTYMEADYNRLKQVLVNLIKNSMEAIGKDGTIKLSAVKKDNKIKIIVEDDGPGMNDEALSKIKEAFFTTKQNGTGLGVYLSNEIIMKHDGSINYSSKEGNGTKVTICLPT